MELKITIPDTVPTTCKNCIFALLGGVPKKKERKIYEPKPLSPEEQAVADRFMALYTPGKTTWESVAKRLGLKGGRGTAWSLAHGEKRPTDKEVQMLEALEFPKNQATANLHHLHPDGARTNQRVRERINRKR